MVESTVQNYGYGRLWCWEAIISSVGCAVCGGWCPNPRHRSEVKNIADISRKISENALSEEGNKVERNQRAFLYLFFYQSLSLEVFKNRFGSIYLNMCMDCQRQHAHNHYAKHLPKKRRNNYHSLRELKVAKELLKTWAFFNIIIRKLTALLGGASVLLFGLILFQTFNPYKVKYHSMIAPLNGPYFILTFLLRHKEIIDTHTLITENCM